MNNDDIDLSEDSDDSIIISGLKDSKSLNRINIMTVNESFKRSGNSILTANKSVHQPNDKNEVSGKLVMSTL